MAIPTALQEALRDSITSGTFIDTKFWAFSKRNSKVGRVGEPKALFVNENVVRRVPRLGALLDQKETKENLRTRYPVHRKPYTGDYDYDADSDLEDDEDCDFSDFEDSDPEVVPEQRKSSKSNSCTEDIQSSDGKEHASDVISISDMDSLFSDSPDTKAETKTAAAPVHVGTVIVIEDVAFVTFQALLRYLYTNEIEFAPWGSKERRKERVLEVVYEPYAIPKPSPKSMYRLADKYDIPELKELALQQIQRDLSKCDIIDEAFSEYTSRYPELRKLELKQLAQALLSTDSSAARRALKNKIKAYSHGHLPHSRDILPGLYDLMESDEAFEEIPALPRTPSNKGTHGGDWKRLKDALTSSLSSGTFLNRQFYALDSKSGSGLPKIRPIYYCSIGGDTFLPNLLKYSSRIGPSTGALLQCVDDYDSDVESEPSEMGTPMDAYPRSTCILEDPLTTYGSPTPALVFKSGTAKTWGAIFFYLYTSQIAFSKIGSPGETAESQEEEASASSPSSETNSPQNLRGTAAVEPCSPKSVYALTSKIGLEQLCDLAFDNIKSQLCENNIVNELFSPFTANHESIMKMQHKLFYSKLKSSVSRSSLSDAIRDSPLGENPHRRVAMELVFDKTIDDCRERMLARAKKSSQADPAEQPSSRGKASSTRAAVTQSTPAYLPPPETQSRPTVVQPDQTQALRTVPDLTQKPPAPAPPTGTSMFGSPLPIIEATSTQFFSLPPSTSQATSKPIFGFGPRPSASQRTTSTFGASPTPPTSQTIGSSFGICPPVQTFGFGYKS